MSLGRPALVIVLLAALTAPITAAPSSSQEPVDGAAFGRPDTVGVRRGDEFLLRSSNTSGPADTSFEYGEPGDVVVVGDWNGDGTDTVGIRRGNAYFLRNSNTPGPAEIVVGYGNPDDIPVVGDWNGDGTDTLGVRRGNVYFLRNSNTSGPADITLGYGSPDDTPVVGDWNGDGTDTLGVRRGNEYFLRNSNTSGPADITLGYGSPDDTPVVGDWNGDGTDTFGVRRGNEYFLRNSNTSGPADLTFAYGAPDDEPIVGAFGPPASSQVPNLSVQTVATGLSIPWGLDIANDGTVLFTQRGGSLDVILPNGTRRALSADLGDVFASGETGVMGLVLDPAFDTNRRFYTCQGHTGPQIQVIAWTVDSAYTTATRVGDPLVGGIPIVSGRHGGCRLRFDPDGFLLIATGDAAVGTHPQNLGSLGGKVLRVNATTGVGAPDNPFAGSANANTKKVYTYGHRNLQGIDVRPGTDEIWTVEHGPSRDDEINRLSAGGNYGWNPVPGYNEGVPMTDLAEFPSAISARWSSGSPTVAPSGAAFLVGAQWGAWEGALAVATLKDSRLRLFFFDSGGTLVDQVIPTELATTFGRLRTVELAPDGSLYVTTANGGGGDRILRVVPT